jgi:hypothetical protein
MTLTEVAGKKLLFWKKSNQKTFSLAAPGLRAD